MLVKAILRQADGSFIGEVYGVTPRQHAVAVGDLVSFSESQIFTFRVEANSGSPADAEMVDMIRAFDASFAAADTRKVRAQPDLEEFDEDFSLAQEPDVSAVPTQQHAAAVRSPGDDFGSALTAPSDRIEKEPGSAGAVSPSEIAEGPKPDLKQERAEPPAVANVRLADTGVASEHQVACIECGAIVHFPRTSDDASATRKLRVACCSCGRINEISEARLASRKQEP